MEAIERTAFLGMMGTCPFCGDLRNFDISPSCLHEPKPPGVLAIGYCCTCRGRFYLKIPEELKIAFSIILKDNPKALKTLFP